MKLRAFFVMLTMSATGVLVANCGSESSSPFGSSGGSGEDGGVPQGPGFVPPTGDGGSVPNGNCTPVTCADLKINCGPAGDGCGGLIESCGTCQGQETCGGGGTPSVCGGTAGCVPKTCQDLGIECGPAGDGCGGVLDCQQCPAPQICGGGGPSKCGGGLVSPDGGPPLLPDGGTCTPRTTCNPGECGPVADGCGGLLNCPGTCPAGQTCGGGGTPSVCGAPACTPTTCTAQNANCGFIADGCGGILNCGGTAACTNAGEFCGGGGPNRCGNGLDGGAPTGCVNYCVDQLKNNTCQTGARTKITGKVFAPNGTLPLPDALVYIPNASKTFPHGVTTFTDGVAAGTCEQCNDSASGEPLISTRTAYDGSFTLDDVPPETDFPLVIQLGRWRRMVTIPALTRCTTTPLTANQTRLPRRQNETSARDNIPFIAISTGQVDGLECVFRKLGIADDQFGNPPGYSLDRGRIRLYRDNFFNGPGNRDAQGGAVINGDTPRTDSALTDSQAHLDQYDAVIFGCAGAQNDRSSTRRNRVRDYANKGGRVFATHYEYVYLYNTNPWNTTADWDVEDRSSGNGTWTGEINTSPGKRATFAQWLGDPLVNALTDTAPPRISITEARNDVDRSVASGAEEWITRYNDPDAPNTAVLHYTFNTPWGAAPANQCGRVLYSDFHVTIGNTSGDTFPNECDNDPLTPQEKVLAFFLFDLTACIAPTTPPPPPTCTARTCAQQGIGCGLAGDGCGGQQDCGECPDGQVCQGSPAQCVTPNCTPATCASKGAQCGQIANGCGSSIDCGPCTEPGQVCGGNGPNQCGAASCTPTTCDAQGIQCGPAGDGCGNLLDCGPCPPGQTCGGGGTPGVCGAPNCTPRTCQEASAQCGFIADGCGGAVDCGPCPPGQTCGGNGVPNQCGGGGDPK